jgi:hypothetical protein
MDTTRCFVPCERFRWSSTKRVLPRPEDVGGKPMSAEYRRYLDLFDELRRVREEHADDADARESAEGLIDDALDALWERLSEDERASTRDESWRAWPDEYSRRNMSLRDVPVWDRPGPGTTPREAARAA